MALSAAASVRRLLVRANVLHGPHNVLHGAAKCRAWSIGVLFKLAPIQTESSQSHAKELQNLYFLATNLELV